MTKYQNTTMAIFRQNGGLIITLAVLFSLCTVCWSEPSEARLSRHIRSIEYGPDIAGPYCETRRGGCCPGRIDECAVPILDTLCYCDAFCNRSRSDCCPDYFSFCLGQRPTTPATIRGACEVDNRPYPPNAKLRINCQDCTCARESGSSTKYKWRCEGDVCLIRDDIIEAVNGGNFGWKATNYSNFWGLTLREGMGFRLGTYKPNSIVRGMNPIKVQSDGRLPESFDARKKWGKQVHAIRDQGNCAASWAFSTTALAADRLSIESRGAILDHLSPQHLLSCNSYGQGGCKGGHLDRAWWFVRKRGVTVESCYPYTSADGESVGRCQLTSYSRAGLRCPSGKPFRKERILKSTPPYRLAMSERDIMAEIQMNGPVQATFKVREDFFMYKSGVYEYSRVVPDSMVGDEEYSYHSVRILGWGIDRTSGRNLKYWLAANSWGTDWGEDGYFRIKRGENECDVEAFVLGAWGKVEGDEELQTLLTRYRSERQRERFDSDMKKKVRGRRHLARRRRRRNRRHHKKQ